LINKLKPKSEFSRNVLTLMTGTSIAQAIPIAITPILTRIYTPEDFGIFALYMSVSLIISVVATGSYEHAIMLPKKDEDAINIVVLSIIISFFISFITFLVVWIFNSEIALFLGNIEISSWLYLIPLTVLLTGIYQSFNYWSNRKKEYQRLAINRVIQSGTIATSNLGMGFSGLGSSGLILGNIFGQAISTTALGKAVWKDGSNRFHNIKLLKIFALSRKYVDFLKFSTFSSILNSLSFNFFSILLSKVFSISILGFYSLVYRILTLPSSLIGNSISQVYFEEATRQKKLYGNNKNIFLETLKKLFIISALVYLPMYFYIKDVVIFVFGSDWKISGEIAQILLPLMFIRFVSSIMSSTLTTYEKQKAGLLINFILFFVLLVLFFLAYIWDLEVYIFFHLYTFTMSILYIFFLFYYYSLARG